MKPLKNLALVNVIWGHGRLMDPPGRGTMWRFQTTNPLLQGYTFIPNYTDNGNNCGGLTHQVNQGTDNMLFPESSGNCGVCGDAYDEAEPRRHEDGGVYGKKIVSAVYAPGQTIKTKGTDHIKIIIYRIINNNLISKLAYREFWRSLSVNFLNKLTHVGDIRGVGKF